MKVVNATTGEEVQPKIIERASYDYLQDEITGLAEDILDLEDDVESIRLGSKMALDIVVKQDEQIKILDDKIRDVDNAGLYLFWFLVIWNVVLSALFALSIYNVL